MILTGSQTSNITTKKPLQKLRMNPFKYSIGTKIRERYFLKLKELYKPTKAAKVLDLGCGMGYFTELLSGQGFDVFGIDIDFQNIRYAKSILNEKLLVGCATKVPFREGCFDIVVCSEVLEHVKDDQCVLDEIYRISRDGAIILITAPCTEGIFGSTIKRIAHGEDAEVHVRDGYPTSVLKEKIERAGIKINGVVYTMVFLVELFMGITKVVYLLLFGKYGKQTDVLKITDKKYLSLFKLLLPLYSLLEYIDSLLSLFLKGHLCLIYGTVQKSKEVDKGEDNPDKSSYRF